VVFCFFEKKDKKGYIRKMIIKIQEAMFTVLSQSSDGNICAENLNSEKKINTSIQ